MSKKTNELILYSKSLFSKHGFDDRDLLHDFLCENILDEISWNEIEDFLISNEIDLLCDIINKFLIPEIEKNHVITVHEMKDTAHNPIRISSIDGKNVDWFDFNFDYLVIPDQISISISRLYNFIIQKSKERII